MDRHLQNMLDQQKYIEIQHKKRDPFDAGIAKAIESARQSMGMNRDQEDKAMRKSLLSFGNAIGQQPKQRGFLANFSSIGKAVAPAIEAHDEVEDESISQNIKMADYLNQLQQAEEAKIIGLEKEAQRRSEYDKMLEARKAEQEEARQYKKDYLAEIKRHNAAKEVGGGMGTVDANGLVEGKYVPFASKSERIPFSKKLAGANITAEHLKHATEVMKNLRNKHGDDLTTLPVGIGHYAGKGQEIYGSLTGNQDSLNKGLERQTLDQVIGTLSAKFEKELKGGILTGDIVKRFEAAGLVPTRWDSPAAIAQKLLTMNKELELERNIAEQSLLRNAYYKEGDGPRQQTNEPHSQQYNEEIIRMIDPEDGHEFNTTVDMLEELMEQGATIK